MSDPDDRIRERVAQAARIREARRRRRERLEEARQHGLQARINAKLARWAQQDDDTDDPQPPAAA